MRVTETLKTVRGQSVRAQEYKGIWEIYAYANGEWVKACTNFSTRDEESAKRYIAKNLQWLHS